MRLELSNEDSLDLFADLLEPVAEILSDKTVTKEFRKGKRLGAVKTAIKSHKKAVIEVLALLDGEDPESYHIDVMTLPIKAIELLNDPAVQRVFTSLAQMTKENASGPVTDNTPDGEA